MRLLNSLKTVETNRIIKLFILFEIKNFYPTIMKNVLTKGLKFPEEKVQISDGNIKIIYAPNSLLFNEGSFWMKEDCFSSCDDNEDM